MVCVLLMHIVTIDMVSLKTKSSEVGNLVVDKNLEVPTLVVVRFVCKNIEFWCEGFFSSNFIVLKSVVLVL